MTISSREPGDPDTQNGNALILYLAEILDLPEEAKKKRKEKANLGFFHRHPLFCPPTRGGSSRPWLETLQGEQPCSSLREFENAYPLT